MERALAYSEVYEILNLIEKNVPKCIKLPYVSS